MWLVDRSSKGLDPKRIELPAELRETLRCWYDGSGTVDDEKASITLVQQARRHQKWLACGCRGSAVMPPLLSPSYLSEAETYYLRRLTGSTRSTHLPDCTYFRDQVPPRHRDKLTARTVREKSEGFFEILKPAPEHLAQAPPLDEYDDRARGATIPKLARLLWVLLDRAQSNIIPPIGSPDRLRRGSIKAEFAAIREAAKTILVAPGVPLADVLFTHVSAYHRRQVFARLRSASRSWPPGHAPQAFMLLFTKAIRGSTITISDDEALTIATRVQSPSSILNPVHGPFLTLIVVGKHPDAAGYDSIGAYAQPIESGRRFVPVASDLDRDVVKAVDRLQWKLNSRGIGMKVTLPLFDTLSAKGMCRPDVVIDMVDQATGEIQFVVIDIDRRLEDAGGMNLASHRDRLVQFGRVVPVNAETLETMEVAIGERFGA